MFPRHTFATGSPTSPATASLSAALRGNRKRQLNNNSEQEEGGSAKRPKPLADDAHPRTPDQTESPCRLSLPSSRRRNSRPGLMVASDRPVRLIPRFQNADNQPTPSREQVRLFPATLPMANRHHNTPSSSVLDAEKQPTTPSREQTRPVPATLPMANRPHNAPSSSVASPAPQARGTPASHANLDHEFTKTVMELIKNQPLAAAIRQKVRETVNRFAFTTNGQRATITDLREKLKAKDGLLQQSDGERNELEHGNRKLRRQIEEKDQELEVSRKHTQKLRENMEKDKDLLLKRAKEITELKARLAELEGGIISRAPTEDLEEEWVGFEEPEGYMAEVEEPVAKEPVEEEPVEEEELLGEEGPPGEQPVDSEMEDTIQVGVEPDVEDPIQAEGQMEVEATSREGIQSDGESMSMESEDSQDSDIDPTPTLGQGPQPLRSSKRTPVKGNARNPYKKTMTYQGFDEDEDEDEEWDAWEEPDDENDDDYVP